VKVKGEGRAQGKRAGLTIVVGKKMWTTGSLIPSLGDGRGLNKKLEANTQPKKKGSSEKVWHERAIYTFVQEPLFRIRPCRGGGGSRFI